MTTLYGIPNCDSIKKARRWLQDANIEFVFHDFRKDGLDEKLLRQWVQQAGWETLLNKRGTTWRKLDENIKKTVDEDAAIRIMLEYPAIIKRPVLIEGKFIEVGFNADRYQTLFA